MTAHRIAKAAARTVGGARHRAYGNPTFGLDRVAAIWNGILKAADKPPAKPLTGFDVAQMMVGLKMARGYTGPHRSDNAIDQAGWSAVAGEVAARFAKKRSR